MERSLANGHAVPDAAAILNDRLSSLEAQNSSLRRLCGQYHKDLQFFRTANASTYAEQRLEALNAELSRIEQL